MSLIDKYVSEDVFYLGPFWHIGFRGQILASETQRQHSKAIPGFHPNTLKAVFGPGSQRVI